MDTIEIKPDVMDLLCQQAQRSGKTITDLVDETLRSLLSDVKTVILKCHNCKQELDYEINVAEGYCDFCQSIVFIDKE